MAVDICVERRRLSLPAMILTLCLNGFDRVKCCNATKLTMVQCSWWDEWRGEGFAWVKVASYK